MAQDDIIHQILVEKYFVHNFLREKILYGNVPNPIFLHQKVFLDLLVVLFQDQNIYSIILD